MMRDHWVRVRARSVVSTWRSRALSAGHMEDAVDDGPIGPERAVCPLEVGVGAIEVTGDGNNATVIRNRLRAIGRERAAERVGKAAVRQGELRTSKAERSQGTRLSVARSRSADDVEKSA